MEVSRLISIATDEYNNYLETGELKTLQELQKEVRLNSSEARYVKFLRDVFIEKSASFSTYEDIIHALEVDLKKIKKKLKIQSSGSGRIEFLLKQIESKIKSSPTLVDTEIISNGKKTVHPITQELVFLISDTHFGENVELPAPDGNGYINKYDIDIAKKRIKSIIEKVEMYTDIHRAYSNIDTLHIAFLGDMVSGYGLHDDLDMTNGLNIAEQILEGSKILSAIILRLSKHFKEIKVYGVCGNHGRTQKKKLYKQPTSSYDYLLYKIVEREVSLIKQIKKLKTDIEFNIAETSFLVTSIQNHTLLFTHGDNIKSWAGIPYYGMMRDYASKQETIISTMDTPINYIVMGHFHQPITINRPLGGIIVNGSLKGVDEYSLANNWISSPSQTLFALNKDQGKTFLYELEPDSE